MPRGRSVSILALLLVAIACHHSSPTEPKPTDLGGTWVGTTTWGRQGTWDPSRKLELVLVESNGDLSGEWRETGPTGDVIATPVVGRHDANGIYLDVSAHCSPPPIRTTVAWSEPVLVGTGSGGNCFSVEDVRFDVERK